METHILSGMSGICLPGPGISTQKFRKVKPCSKFWPTKDKRWEGPRIWMVAVPLTCQEMSRRCVWVTGNIFSKDAASSDNIQPHIYCPPSFSGSVVKNPPVMQETWVPSLGQEDPLEEEMSTHSSILACKIPWTEEPDRLRTVHRVTKESDMTEVT